MNKTDALGWKPSEKAVIVIGAMLFKTMDNFYQVLYRLSGQRIYMPVSGKVGRVWLLFAGWGYLYEDLRAGTMPENIRIGGVWRGVWQ